jgi:hypothetical protein
MELEEGDELKR